MQIEFQNSRRRVAEQLARRLEAAFDGYAYANIKAGRGIIAIAARLCMVD
jgi:hypothetical protein